MCRQWQNKVWGYIEGELSVEATRALERHLEWCESCRQALEAARTTLQTLRALPRYTPPANLSAQVQTRLQFSRQPSHLTLRTPRLRFPWLLPRWVWSPVLALALLIGGWFLWQHSRPAEIQSARLELEYLQTCFYLHETLPTVEAAADPASEYILTSGYEETR